MKDDKVFTIMSDQGKVDFIVQFQNYYGEFAQYLDKEDKSTNRSFICFGSTGAGKSTFIARLKSNAKKEDFYKSITEGIKEEENKSKGYMELEGIKIGLGFKSTTIVPQSHIVDNGVKIYDMPGFYDVDPDKRIIIAILHKCFLNRIQDNNIYLVLLNGGLFSYGNLDSKVVDYCNSLKSLFGQNFNDFLNSTYFIISNTDRVEYNEKQFKESMTEHLIALSGDPNQINLQKFLLRMKTNSMFVNYKTQDKTEILQTLKKFTKFDENINAAVIQSNRLDKTDLNAYEHQFNEKVLDKINLIRSYIDKSYQIMLTEITLKVKQFAENKVVIEREYEVYKKIVAETEATSKLIDSLTREVEEFAKKKKKLEDDIMFLTEQIDNNDKLTRLVDSSLKEYSEVGYRCDVSQKRGLLGNGFSVDALIDIDQSCYTDNVILVTRYESDNKSLKDHVNSTTVIPRTLSEIKIFKSSNVLYNNGVKYDPKLDIKINALNKQISINASYNMMFKVYVFYEIKFESTTKFGDIISSFKTKGQQFSQNLEAKKRELEKLITDHNNNLLRIDTLKKKIVENTSNKDIIMNKIKQTIADSKGLYELIYDENLRYAKGQVDRHTIMLLETLKEINKIFNYNKLINEFGGSLSNIETTLVKYAGDINLQNEEVRINLMRLLENVAF